MAHERKRWVLESWDGKRGWRTEAEWADGNSSNGTPRKERALKEAKELSEAGITARVIDRLGNYSTYEVALFGAVPNVVLTRLRGFLRRSG